jgi:hypothetical protein
MTLAYAPIGEQAPTLVGADSFSLLTPSLFPVLLPRTHALTRLSRPDKGWCGAGPARLEETQPPAV